jgi:hypothetical protein
MALLESVFNHLVLPQKLPRQQDINIEEIEINVLTRLLDACDTLGEAAGPGLVEAWMTLGRSLRVCLDLNLGRLEKASLLREFHNLRQNHLLILYVQEQNAALLIRNQSR